MPAGRARIRRRPLAAVTAAVTAAVVLAWSSSLAPDAPAPLAPPQAAADVPLGLHMPRLGLGGARAAVVVAMAAQTTEPDEPDVTRDAEPASSAPPSSAEPTAPVTPPVTATTPRPGHRARPPVTARRPVPAAAPTVTVTRDAPRRCS